MLNRINSNSSHSLLKIVNPEVVISQRSSIFNIENPKPMQLSKPDPSLIELIDRNSVGSFNSGNVVLFTKEPAVMASPNFTRNSIQQMKQTEPLRAIHNLHQA